MLHALVETLVGVMHEDVSGPYRREDGLRSILKSPDGKRRPGRIVKLRQGQTHKLEKRSVIDLLIHVENVRGRELEAFPQHFPHSRIGAGPEFEADYGLVAPLAHLRLDRLADFRGCIVVQLHLRVSGKANQRDRAQIHASIEFLKISTDDFVKRHECLLAWIEPTGKGNPLFQPIRNPDARVHLLVPHGVAQEKDQRDRKVRDEWKRVDHVDNERSKRRRHVGIEIFTRFPLLLGGQFVPAPQGYPVAGEFRNDVVPVALGLKAKRRQELAPQALQQLPLLFGLFVRENRHPFHEELIQVRREDSEKFGPFQQGRALVQGLRQNSLVKIEPA